jgi:hypothetical protein
MNHHHLSHLFASTLKPTPTHLPLSSTCCIINGMGGVSKRYLFYMWIMPLTKWHLPLCFGTSMLNRHYNLGVVSVLYSYYVSPKREFTPQIVVYFNLLLVYSDHGLVCQLDWLLRLSRPRESFTVIFKAWSRFTRGYEPKCVLIVVWVLKFSFGGLSSCSADLGQ